MTSSGSNARWVDRYIYDLPFAQHRELCRILDRDNKWEVLGGVHMHFDLNTIQDLRRDDQRGKSPTSQLLTKWGQQNHTVVQLFVLLSRMHHYRAMTVLKPLVDSRFHDLIYEGEENVSALLDKEKNCSPSDSRPQQQEISNAEAGSGGAVPQTNSSVDKNMNVLGDNMNQEDKPCDLGQDKMLLPPHVPEKKIVNKPMPLATKNKSEDNQSNNGVPHVIVNSPSSDIPPPHSSQPPAQNGAAMQQSVGKENKPVNQERKMSCASDVSTVAESIPLISYSEMESATHGWNKKTIIGKGGFGTVFKGNWKNTLVAIKRIEQRGAESRECHQAQMEQLLQELRILNSCRHDNILPLYGFSMDGVDPCLVYQFMPNGSLEDRLLCRQGTAPLSWLQRHTIARGTARGLQFLHGKPFIHGDVKSANILLDKNFEPRIGDFGLAREGPQGHYTHMKISRIHGTLAYLPIDFLRNKQLSTKVDTFSFGVVVFELATGLRAYDDKRRQKLLRDYILETDRAELLEMYDTKPGVVDRFVYDYMIELGRCCVRRGARERPDMEEVLKHLDSINCRLIDRFHYMAPNTQPSRSPVPHGPPQVFVNSELPQTPIIHPALPRTVPLKHHPNPYSPASPVPVPSRSILPDGRSPLPNTGRTGSSVGTSQGTGAAASASTPPSNAVVPLLSALGTVDSRDSQEIRTSQTESGNVSHNRQTRRPSLTPEITAKGKPLLCGDLSN